MFKVPQNIYPRESSDHSEVLERKLKTKNNFPFMHFNTYGIFCVRFSNFWVQRDSVVVAPRIDVWRPLIQNIPPNVLPRFHDFYTVMCFLQL